MQEQTMFKKEDKDKKPQKQVSVVSNEEISNLKRLDEQKLAAKMEDEKRKKYEESLRERIITKENIKNLIELEPIRSKFDD